MAWLSLVVVTLVFYTPFIGLGPTIAAQDVALVIPLPLVPVAMSIPFTGPLRLLFYSMALWAVLWGVLFLLERLTRTDFLVQSGLRNDLVYAVRPYISIQIAERLAGWVLVLAVIRIVVLILLQMALNALLPWLVTRFLPEVVARFAPEIAAQAVPVIATQVRPLLELWIARLTRFDFGAMLVVFCLLVLIVKRAFYCEQRYRLDLDLRHHRLRRRREQKAIVMPPTPT